MRSLWQKLSRYAQGMILVMVSVLFFAWGILGAAQVQNQNETILEGVHEAVDDSLILITNNQRAILAQSKYITCVLKTLPQDRTPRNIHRCLRKSGLEEVEVLGAVTIAPDSREHFVAAVNRARVNKGCREVRETGKYLIRSARKHSQRMARRDLLFHSTLTAGRWSRVAEIVGVGRSWRSIFFAFLDSKRHRRIILGCVYDKIAVGMFEGGGRVWLTARFYAR